MRLPLSAVHRSTGVGLLADEATKYDLVVGESTIGVMMHHTQDLEQGSSEVCNESCVVRIHSTALRAAEVCPNTDPDSPAQIHVLMPFFLRYSSVLASFARTSLSRLR